MGQQALLQTKLQRPRVTADLVDRPRLTQALNDGLDRPLILVAAPAGFGKSTLVSAWLETCDLPHAWLALDEADNDLGVFLAYFVRAMQTIVPDALPETQALLAGISLPVVSVVAKNLLNELDGLGRNFILALDDYHLIREQPIHELLSLLLQHPPQGMHLVIVTRLGPPLSLGVLRARHQLAEIRGQDLRFSRAEIAAFVERALKVPLTDEALAMLTEKTEGWAAGLRFAILALRHVGDIDRHLAGLYAENPYVIDYLMQEVLSQVSPAMMRFLLKTSILDQMCVSLCHALIGPDDPECQPQEFLAWLEQAAMFTVALDARGEWYRYHHLFQELLRRRLAREANDDQVAALHVRASVWYANQGSLEEALQHAVQGKDMATAARLVAEQRHALMNSEQWQLLERLLRMFPADVIAREPDLLLLQAGIASTKAGDATVAARLLDQIENLLAQAQVRPEHAVHLRGEIDALRSMIACAAANDFASAVDFARRSLDATPRTWYFVRSVAYIYLAVALQASGQLEEAYAALAEGEPEDMAPSGAVYCRIAGARGFVEWMAGDLPALAQGAAQLQAVAETHRRHETLAWAHYLSSVAAYERNDLAGAEAHVNALDRLRFTAVPMAYLQSVFIDALIHQARGQPNQARQQLDGAFAFLQETTNQALIPLTQAFQADLAVRQGDLGAARHWATTIGPFLPLSLMPYFYAPQLTLPKILLAQSTAASLAQATEVLARLHAFVTANHNTRFTIEILALQALLHDTQGDEQAALARLQQAVSLAEPGGFIRLFVDLGPRLANLLGRLRQVGPSSPYINRILRAFSDSTPAAPRPQPAVSPREHLELVEPLTDRELEILALLAQRLTAKEIAQALVISPMTVKRHASNIYGKLQVNGRREAVAKATRLGLL